MKTKLAAVILAALAASCASGNTPEPGGNRLTLIHWGRQLEAARVAIEALPANQRAEPRRAYVRALRAWRWADFTDLDCVGARYRCGRAWRAFGRAEDAMLKLAEKESRP